MASASDRASAICPALAAATMSASRWRELAPGKETNPSHYHMLEEEHAYILEGALTLKLGARNYVMKAGDYICFPAGQKVGHS